LAESTTYVLNPSSLSQARAEVGDSGVMALELPKRAYSAIIHNFLGWSEGLLLLSEPEIEKMISVLESKLQTLVGEIAELPGSIVLSPDNLDGQFVSPGAFDGHLEGSYWRTAETLEAHGMWLVTHVGGPVARLLERFATTGLDAIQGICGPPQSDTPLLEARGITGPGIALWGGIPQDVLLDTQSREQFEQTVVRVASEASGTEQMLLGVTEWVAVNASLDRLQAIRSLIIEGFSR